MKSKSIEFIYQAMNAIASGKHDAETEQQLCEAVEEEILALNASLMVKGWAEITVPGFRAEASIS